MVGQAKTWQHPNMLKTRTQSASSLRPRESETRQIKDLSGLWHFTADPEAVGESNDWPQHGLPEHQLMPVPSSMTQDPTLKDYMGWIWYERDDFVPRAWQGQDVALWIGAAAHVAKVWVNGHLIAEHEGGFLSFSGSVTDILHYGASNKIVIAIDTRLSWRVLPPGQVAGRGNREDLPEDWQVNDFHFDFVNYVGLHRPVKWLVQPQNGLQDLALTPGLEDGTTGTLAYDFQHGAHAATVRVVDEGGAVLAEASHQNEESHQNGASSGTITVAGVTPWAPWRRSCIPLKSKLWTLMGPRWISIACVRGSVLFALPMVNS
jgi:beta-glucuronidase